MIFYALKSSKHITMILHLSRYFKKRCESLEYILKNNLTIRLGDYYNIIITLTY